MQSSYLSESATEYLEATKSHNERIKCCQRINGCLCNLISFVVCGTIALVAGLVVWNHFGQPTNLQEVYDAMGKYNVDDFFNVLQNLTDNEWIEGFNEDPYVGDNSTEVWAGTDGYSGLALTLQNALDDTWQTEFAAAVQDWKECQALTLTTEQVDVDHSCARVEGVMKVCNGNFGATGWVGINEIEVQYSSKEDPGVIISSVAKMNEYYLLNADYAHRQYTMCHEIGHGFGLPHTDENPNNQDQGNCLDYTNTPANNIHPGSVNFQRLLSMYMKDYYNDADDYINGDDDAQANNYDDQMVQYDDDFNEQGGRHLRRVILKHYHYV